MSTVVYKTVHVFADTIPDTPCAIISHDGARYYTTLYTGKNSESLPPVDVLADALTVADAHAAALDGADSKDTNLDLLFKIKELEAIIAELRAARGDVAVEAVK